MSWLKGKGTAGVATDPNIAPAAKFQADKEDAKAGVAGVINDATGNTSVENRVIAHIVAEGAKGKTIFDIKTVAQETGASVAFLRFFSGTERKVVLELRGYKVVQASLASFEIMSMGGATAAAPVAAPAATPAAPAPASSLPKVKAASKGTKAAQAAVAAQPAPAPAAPANDEDFFYFEPLLRAKILASIKFQRNHWIYGPTGAGKSEFYERLLNELGIAFEKVNCHGESSADDALGHYTLRGGETVWIEGALVKAMRAGVPFIIEELDIAPAEVNMVLQRVLEIRPGQPRKFHNARNGEDVVAGAGFFVLGTGNSAGGGDHTGLYAGVQTQNAAFRDRFNFDRVNYLPEAIEIEVLVKRTGIGRALAELAVKFATAARQALKNGDLFTPVSTRSLLAFGWGVQQLRAVGLDLKVATTESMMSAVIYKAASPSDEEALRGMVQRVFGGN